MLEEKEEPGFLTGLKIPAPWAAGKTVETVHPVRDNYKFKETVHIPGARCLYLRFDNRCSSQYDYDKVSKGQLSTSAVRELTWKKWEFCHGPNVGGSRDWGGLGWFFPSEILSVLFLKKIIISGWLRLSMFDFSHFRLCSVFLIPQILIQLPPLISTVGLNWAELERFLFSLMIKSLFTWIHRNKYLNFKQTTNSTYPLCIIRELLAECCCLFFGIEQFLMLISN